MLEINHCFFGLESLTCSVFSFVRSVSGLFFVQNVLAVVLRSIYYSIVINKDCWSSWLLLYTLTFNACVHTLYSDYVRKVKTKKEVKTKGVVTLLTNQITKRTYQEQLNLLLETFAKVKIVLQDLKFSQPC
jgi:hypothetical protein